jgi:hypothetical protein
MLLQVVCACRGQRPVHRLMHILHILKVMWAMHSRSLQAKSPANGLDAHGEGAPGFEAPARRMGSGTGCARAYLQDNCNTVCTAGAVLGHDTWSPHRLPASHDPCEQCASCTCSRCRVLAGTLWQCAGTLLHVKALMSDGSWAVFCTGAPSDDNNTALNCAYSISNLEAAALDCGRREPAIRFAHWR